MYLKSLALRGFKSFASATTLHFEPGITAVVGPNGSGKSNVVDAIAWVLGEQGAKALRGGKMDDVIFAGTADRQPLGRAEVTLTINNADGALPIDYDEVAITRRMFRDGASDYEINGKGCRLLDIQDLLSDSGIGREMHVIVGQGQLDAVLSARPEDRRAFIEEAAGVLKHRKRKEKALRKLDAMQANLTRLADLTGELRRQLKPLGRQAEVARRAMSIQSELRDARLRLLADDLVTLQGQVATEAAEEQAAQDRRDRVQSALAIAHLEEEFTAAAAADAAPALQEAQETWFALSALSERFRGTVNLAAERARNLSAPVDEVRAGRDPDALEAAARAADEEQADKDAAVETARVALDVAVGDRTARETALRQAESELLAATRAIADRREGLATLNGTVNTARSRLAAVADEINRLSTALAGAQDRAESARDEFAGLTESIGALGDNEVGLDETYQSAQDEADRARDRMRELVEAQQAAVSEQRSLRARVDALELGLTRRDGTGALLTAHEQLAGLLGPVSQLVTVRPGAEAAIAAALGTLGDAVAVADLAGAVATLDWLRAADAGRAGLLIGDTTEPGRDELPELPVGVSWAVHAVQAPVALRSALAQVLDRLAIVPDLAAAAALVRDRPDLRAVTLDGELLSAHSATGGQAGQQSLLEIQAAVDEAQARLSEVSAGLERVEAALSGARADAEQREWAAAEALRELNDSDAQLSAVEEQLGRLAETARAATAEADRLERQRQTAEESRAVQQAALADLEARLAAVQDQDVPAVVDSTRRDQLAELTAASRQREMEDRLALRTVEERARASAGSAESLRRAARAERETRARAETARARRAAAAALATRVLDRATAAADVLAVSLQTASAARDSANAARAAADQAAGTARSRVAELASEWEKLTSQVHREEVLRAQQAIRVEQLIERATTEFAITVEDLVAEFGPAALTPPSAVEMAEFEAARDRGEQVYAPQPMAFDRSAAERKLRSAERDLVTLGKVNPLALEEFAALEERHAFLSTQLTDLKDTRRDLMTVVGEVDQKIQEVFASAFHDVAREFVTVFQTLFPGGEGSLVLTDPEDLLTTGIEVNARPPGKKVKRLSLLSGGERSLTAVAILVSIFRARPSPFYVMDEVEAALDEVNLTRLVTLLSELRESSQLIIITHQKFTMEAADALYGVSMRGDGITQVISQRIRGVTPTVPAAPVAAPA